MKHFLLRAFKLLLAVLFPGFLFAQTNPDFNLLLQSGKFVPQENLHKIKKDPEVLNNSVFRGKHYLTLQFRKLPTQEEKTSLSAIGVQLIDYIPNLAYTATLPQGFDLDRLKAFQVRSIIKLTAAQKSVPALLQGNFPAHSIKQTGYADVTVITYEKLNAASLTKELTALNAVVLEDLPMFRTFTIRVPQKNITKLIALPFVQWVEPVDAPNVPENLLGRSLHRVNILNDGLRNLKGDSINIGIWDGGEVSPHLDFSPVASRLNIKEASFDDSHSTHVAGTIGGRGIINPKARGMAPNSKIYSYNFNGTVTAEMASAIPTFKLLVSNHSYGSTQTCGLTGAGVAYSTTSRNTDLNLNTYPSHLHVHSAGNSQGACTGGWSTITGSGKTAKNNIVVANITTTETISGSSSFGPVADGRVKPEISSLGTNVLSTYTPLNKYATTSGTSMATPGVTGTVALLVQHFKQLNSNTAPISSLIKAVTCNTAQELGNPGPDYKFGFGRINALAAAKALEQNRYKVGTIATGAATTNTITVPPGALRLKVMLTWNDPAGTPNVTQALVNNLDLSVINGNTITLPWVLNPNSPGSSATKGVDNVSNIEQVTVENPVAGVYTLKVNGTAVPVGPSQQYSLTWEIDQPFIEITYPNGGESFSPGEQETITWDNAGVTSNQTIQYSLDNGASWNTLSATVPAGTTRYAWTIPAGLNTGIALVRVTAGNLSDQSDATFKILGTPVSLKATEGICAGSLTFTWPAITNATHYNLFMLDDKSGQWTMLAADIVGTTYTTTGLSANKTLWFTLSAKNNITGATSEKALAISQTLTNTAPKIEVNISAAPYADLHPGLTTTLTATTNQTDPVTYSWMRNGVIIPGKTTKSIDITVDELGTYSAIATLANGCFGTSNSLIIGESASDQTFIYPNPNNGIFYIRYNNKAGETRAHTITVYDAKGARVGLQNHNIKASYDKMEVDLSKQSRGIYLVILTDSSGKKLTASRVFVQ